MIERRTLLEHLDTILQTAKFRDYCPNCLQVEGHEHIGHIVTGITASQALVDAAIERGADTILVLPGYFWKGQDERGTGIKRERLKALLATDITPIAYRLPLDSPPVYGNNVQQADVLNPQTDGPLSEDDSTAPG